MFRKLYLIAQVWRLAILELKFEWASSVCRICAIIGMVAPLLFLCGVKEGHYRSQLDSVMSDPRSLFIFTLDEGNFDQTDVSRIGTWPGVLTVAPRTRSITRTDAEVRSMKGGTTHRVYLSPHMPNDPRLMNGIQIDQSSAALGQLAADKIGVTVGDEINIIARGVEGRQTLEVQLSLVAIVPTERSFGSHVLLSPALMDQFEAYYDGYAIPSLGILDGAEYDARVVQYEGVELYANNLANVVEVIDRLTEEFGVPAYNRNLDVVESILNLDAKLKLVLVIIIVGTLTGLSITIGSIFYEATERKRVTFATLAQLGLPRWWRMLIASIQAIVIGVFGLLVSFLLIGLLVSIRSVFWEEGGVSKYIVLSLPWHGFVVGGVLLMLAVGSGLGFHYASRSDPAINQRKY